MAEIPRHTGRLRFKKVTAGEPVKEIFTRDARGSVNRVKIFFELIIVDLLEVMIFIAKKFKIFCRNIWSVKKKTVILHRQKG